ncbi:hypothetical protein [Flavobacterium sp. ABG]|uniref:hypothetical protein n=1 Tax=Flavobacterium sp. ABG TaxID=1423322 RepID=UPI00064A290C|nr:hypothetical protein [Flavobacterium sp. ABG]KLT70496.1 hypothetical protein AB674_07455 [Flavobacterium sp. ABG]
MFDEAKKSVESILSQRLTSPFYGTLIVSWLIWNWKIIYLTIFISEKNIRSTKIDYITANYNDTWHIVWYPLISTAVLLLFLPLITNGAFWLDLLYYRWRVNKKNFVESKQLLTIEDSMNLREIHLSNEKRFETLLEDKNKEIEQLKLIIEDYSNEFPIIDTDDSKLKAGEDDILKLVNKIKENKGLSDSIEIVRKYANNGTVGLQNILDAAILNFFISNDIIEKSGNIYLWTHFGKRVNKFLTNEKYNLLNS